LLDELLTELPAVFITGPRAAGKTTTAARRAATIVRLDHEAEAIAFRADPDAALRGLREPVLLDEWQAVPDVLGAVKRAVDTLPEPGRFLVTGSVRGDLDPRHWPGTGRLTRVPLFGMSVREQHGALPAMPFLDRVAAGAELEPAPGSPDLRGYVEILARSGFPEATLRLTDRARDRWFESYVEQLLTHDVEQLESGRDPGRLRRYFEALALSTAGIVSERSLYDAAGINRKTALAYQRLLAQLVAVESVPAWTSNRLKRLVLSPKRYLVDPGLAAAVLGADVDLILRDGNLLGRLLDTFVMAQLRAELATSSTRPRLYHVRQQDGRLEVDILAELSAGRLIAVEVKADSAPGPAAARHLASLRDSQPDAFVAGIVLHTGPRAYRLGDRIFAVPISALWA
jgi:predicted AAA+ superfamily ATPase